MRWESMTYGLQADVKLAFLVCGMTTSPGLVYTNQGNGGGSSCSGHFNVLLIEPSYPDFCIL